MGEDHRLRRRIQGPEHPDTLNAMSGVVESILLHDDLSDQELKRALGLAKERVERDQKSQLGWRWLAVAEYRHGHWDAAIQAVERRGEAPHDESWAIPALVMARSHARQGEVQKAHEWSAKVQEHFSRGERPGVVTPRRIIDDATARLGVTPPPGEDKEQLTSKAVRPPG